jgi:hypothetical protein
MCKDAAPSWAQLLCVWRLRPASLQDGSCLLLPGALLIF